MDLLLLALVQYKLLFEEILIICTYIYWFDSIQGIGLLFLSTGTNFETVVILQACHVKAKTIQVLNPVGEHSWETRSIFLNWRYEIHVGNFTWVDTLRQISERENILA